MDEKFFLLGLGSFLLAQLSYLAGFLSFPEARQGLVARAPWRAWLFVLYLAGILYVLWPGIPGPMRAPVAVYACSIVAMGTATYNLNPFLERKFFLGLMAGILLFIQVIVITTATEAATGR